MSRPVVVAKPTRGGRVTFTALDDHARQLLAASLARTAVRSLTTRGTCLPVAAAADVLADLSLDRALVVVYRPREDHPR